MTNRLRYCILLLFASVAFVSCIYEDFDMECEYGVPAAITDGYSLALNVTLDKMGGVSATRADYNPMEEVEDYVNPEKFRVLFFDSQYRFLFESKSRWVKLLSQDADKTSWFVSIPIFSYGNDVKYNWPWKQIREELTTTEKNIDPQKDCFYIAILANRPTIECFPDLDKTMNGTKNFDNSGPHWFLENTAGYTGNNGDVKSVFDLHHCQWDPIYTSKNTKDATHSGYYEIVMGIDPKPETVDGIKKEFLMGATSCWVDHGPTMTDDGVKDGFGNRTAIHPSKDYPIPMYGIQRFTKIPADAWTKGTPFNLSVIPHVENKNGAYKDYTANISLLRSVVKLELRIPRKYQQPKYVGLTYSNIYARCEPMDVWTPTNDIWEKEHDKDCEWKTIMSHALMSQNYSETGTSKGDYWNRLWWFYGAWMETNPATGNPWWNFNTDKSQGNGFNPNNRNHSDSPKIFNPCIQRNQRVTCTNAMVEDDEYYHYVVYTGERNVNDPSDLAAINKQGTTIYWYLSFDADDKRNLYNNVSTTWNLTTLQSKLPTNARNNNVANWTVNFGTGTVNLGATLEYISGTGTGKWDTDSDGTYIQPNGGGSKTSRTFKITVPSGGLVRIKAKSANNTATRQISVDPVRNSAYPPLTVGGTAIELEFSVARAGDVYIFPTDNPIRFYEIEFSNPVAFCIPIGDYTNTATTNPLINVVRTEYTPFLKEEKKNDQYEMNTNEHLGSTYQRDVQNGTVTTQYRPYPLLRNHVYTLTLGSTTGDYSTRAGETNFTITS
ncbi:MAG: hypothetical protein J1E33_06830, partial [Alistipes sp.]|nr:hypothetical protein [Alistipes sp.]